MWRGLLIVACCLFASAIGDEICPRQTGATCGGIVDEEVKLGKKVDNTVSKCDGNAACVDGNCVCPQGKCSYNGNCLEPATCSTCVCASKSDCNKDYCKCGADQCATPSWDMGPLVCYDQCASDTGGTCALFSCRESRGPTNCVNGKCLCQKDYCSVTGAVQGMCVSGLPTGQSQAAAATDAAATAFAEAPSGGPNVRAALGLGVLTAAAAGLAAWRARPKSPLECTLLGDEGQQGTAA